MHQLLRTLVVILALFVAFTNAASGYAVIELCGSTTCKEDAPMWIFSQGGGCLRHGADASDLLICTSVTTAKLSTYTSSQACSGTSRTLPTSNKMR